MRKWNGDVALLASPDKVARRKEQFNSPVPDPSRRPLSSQPPSSGGWRAAASPAPSPAPPAPCTPPSPVPDAISPAALVCSAAPEPRQVTEAELGRPLPPPPSSYPSPASAARGRSIGQMIDTAFASLAESDWSADGLGERMSMIVRSSGVVCRANSGASPQASSPKRSAVWR